MDSLVQFYFMINLKDIPKLSKEDQDKLEQDITEIEILNSLKELKNGKTPGTDGFTVDFYKFFWIDMKKLLLESLTYALNKGNLSIEQRKGEDKWRDFY